MPAIGTTELSANGYSHCSADFPANGRTYESAKQSANDCPHFTAIDSTVVTAKCYSNCDSINAAEFSAHRRAYCSAVLPTQCPTERSSHIPTFGATEWSSQYAA